MTGIGEGPADHSSSRRSRGRAGERHARAAPAAYVLPVGLGASEALRLDHLLDVRDVTGAAGDELVDDQVFERGDMHRLADQDAPGPSAPQRVPLEGRLRHQHVDAMPIVVDKDRHVWKRVVFVRTDDCPGRVAM